MAESQPKLEPRPCYLCDRVKYPWTIILSYSEPVCRRCLFYIGSSQIELEIQRTNLLNDRQRELHEFTNSLPSTSGSAPQEKKSISRVSSMPVLGQEYPSARNSSTAGKKLDKAPVANTDETYDAGRSTAKSASAIAVDSLAPQVLESQNLSNSSPHQKQQGIQNKIQFFICWICKQREVETRSIQCPVEPAHIFCIPCSYIHVSKCTKSYAKTHCPSGKCILSENDITWRFPEEDSSAIITAKDSEPPQVSEQQNSSISSPSQQEQGNQTNIQFFCLNCKRRQGSKKGSVQCPLVPAHIFCFKCAHNYLLNQMFVTGIHCPSGRKCAPSETGIAWKFTKAKLDYIDSLIPKKNSNMVIEEKKCDI